jgi:pyruvate dehydrogenase phosphatase
LKFHSSFLTQIFSYLPTTASASYIPGITKYSKTPPYVIAKPSLRYINLQPFRERNPILLLFTDGVDNLVSGTFDSKAMPRKDDPSDVVGALLGDKVGSRVKGILGHEVEPRWHGCNGNRAIEVLGNLLGGTDVGRLSETMNPPTFTDANAAEIYIDDTSIIVCDISRATISS